MAEQALFKLDFRSDKKILILAGEVLYLEQVSLIIAQQWSAMYFAIIQGLGLSTLLFAGNPVTTNADHPLLLAVDDNDFFMSTVAATHATLFFLSNAARMTDEAG